ncbi:MAG TPA: fibronectin type III domain-containing protein, partial [Myxococcota bacterium]|nr:fibronectin type III domain-containing protein [Myxococcota bacterium]
TCGYLDTFSYTVNRNGIGGTTTGNVAVPINRPPTLTFTDLNSFVCQPVGTANTTLNLLPDIYSDPDDGTATMSALTATAGAANFVTSLVNKTIQITPTNVALAQRYSVSVSATDNALSNAANNSRGTANGTWEVVWNDGPMFKVVTPTVVADGDAATPIAFNDYVDNLGLANGQPFLSPDSPWASVQVGAAIGGPFGPTADLGDGSSCAVSGSLDSSTITFTAGTGVASKSCFVQVCEVCGSTPVCSVKELEYTIVDAVTDTFAAAEQVNLVLDVADDLLTNDINVDEATFTLLDTQQVPAPTTSTNTADGGFVQFDVGSGEVTYIAKVGASTTDSFVYRVCHTSGSPCDDVTVNINVNRSPILAATTTCVPLNTATVSLDLDPAQNPTFTDPDGDELGAVTPTPAVPGTPNTDDDGTLTAGAGGNELLFTPDDIGIANSYAAAYTACDDGNPAACKAATWTVLYNDAPTFKASATFAVNGPTTLNLTTGANPEDLIQTFGGVDSGSITVRVADTSNGYPAPPGDDQSVTLQNGTCAVVNGTIVFTPDASPAADTDSCFVEVCECTGVCAEKEVVFTVVGCLVNGDCTNEPADSCSGNVIQTFPGECNMSGDCEYNAVPGATCDNGCFNGTCNAQAPAFSDPATGAEDGTAFAVTFQEVADLGASNGRAPADVDVRVTIEVGPAGGLQSLTLNWTANDFTNTTPVVMTKMGQNAGKDVYEAVIPGQAWMTTVRFYLEADPWTGANFFDPGNNTNYTYVTEECTRDAHCTDRSGGVCGASDLCEYPPTAPLNVLAADDADTVEVVWDAPTSTGGSPITGYTATLYENGNPTALTCTSATLDCDITSVPNGTYTVLVKATNARGDSPNSAPSDPVTVAN